MAEATMKAEPYRILDATTMKTHSQQSRSGKDEAWTTSYWYDWYPILHRYIIVDGILLKEIYRGDYYCTHEHTETGKQPNTPEWDAITERLWQRASSGDIPDEIVQARECPPPTS